MLQEAVSLIKKEAALGWSLLFVLCAVLSGLAFHAWEERFTLQSRPELFGVGGPENRIEEKTAAVFGTAMHPVAAEIQSGITDEEIYSWEDSAILVGRSHSLTTPPPFREDIMLYTVREGDTLSEIAARYGISVDTIRYANEDTSSNLLKIDQKLAILPTDGILYTVREGDTLRAVAERFEISPEEIREYNPDYLKTFQNPEEKLMLPHKSPGLATQIAIRESPAELPDLSWYFALPAKGWNWGKLHEYNAVDIADSCGSPFYASAGGIVIEESSSGSWNSGYGNYILIEHANGTETRYAHTLKNDVEVGDIVKQGQKIGSIGNTGNSEGATGCHLHFEVIGAKNPFALR